MENRITNKGDNNILLQNVTAQNITILSGKEENTELKNEKSKMAERIAALMQVVGLRFDENDRTEEDKLIIDNDLFNEIDFEELVKSIEFGNCVLFLGPEISVNEQGKSLHNEFFKKISNKKRKYNENEGFFMPGAENRLINVSKEYYSNLFHEENTIANKILKKLAQIPFSLIVSLAPDDTLHKIYESYNLKHHFLFYTGTKHENNDFEDSTPIIYNALGAAAENGRFIYTHKQYNEYLKNDIEAKFPFEIEDKIKKEDTTHYLFIGFDFNQWHNRLIMYELNLSEDLESFALSQDTINESNKEFIEEQFDISFIDAKYEEFTELLLSKSKEAGLTKSLDKKFSESILQELEEIRVKTYDAEKLEQVKQLSDELEAINDKISKS